MKLKDDLLSGPEKEGELCDYEKLAINEKLHGYSYSEVSRQRLLTIAVELKYTDLAESCAAATTVYEERKLLLLFAKFLGNRMEYCSQPRPHGAIVNRIEMILPCGMHCVIRVDSTLLTNGCKQIDSRTDITQVQKKLLQERLEEAINQSIGSGTSAAFRFTFKGDMIQTVSLSAVKLVQVMDNWAALVDIIFADLTEPADLALKAKWRDMGERFVDCMLLMNYKFDMGPVEVKRFQLCMDLFTRLFRELIGQKAETNYVQNMSAGVFRYFAAEYGSIYAYNNTAMEACAGSGQNYFQHGTQHDVDGHRGKPLVEAVMDHHYIGRAVLMNKLVPGTLNKAVADGKAAIKPLRNEKDRKRRANNNAMQSGGVNLVGRTIKVGQRGSNGKLTFMHIALNAGDLMPVKAKRAISESCQLTNAICKRLKNK
jgi:hypothetical protein